MHIQQVVTANLLIRSGILTGESSNLLLAKET